MTEALKWTRRAVLAAKAALGGALTLPLPGFAAARDGAGAGGALPSARSVAPARWHSATARELQPFVGQRFRVHTQEHGTLALKLTHVASPASDPDRPAHLPRPLAVTATFEGPDVAILAASEDTTHRLSHPKIGSVDAYLKTMPRRSGGYEMELVLN